VYNEETSLWFPREKFSAASLRGTTVDTPKLRTALSHEIAILALEVIELEKKKLATERRLEFYQQLEKDLEERGMSQVFG
jgi:hypothetical protein